MELTSKLEAFFEKYKCSERLRLLVLNAKTKGEARALLEAIRDPDAFNRKKAGLPTTLPKKKATEKHG